MNFAQSSSPANQQTSIGNVAKYGIIEVYPTTLTELAKQYRVDSRTLARWLKKFEYEIGERVGRFYSVNQVETIIKCLGAPYEVSENG